MYNKCEIIANYLLVVIFFIIIFLPLIFFNHQEGKISIIENKTLRSKPKFIQENGGINENYVTEFEEYFDDNIGFKEIALEANIIYKYKLFGVVDIPNWMLGENGNLFYTSGGEDIRTYCGLNKYSEEEMQEMAECLYNMNLYFQQKNCYTYNMFIPNKEAVYNEVYNPYVYHDEESRQDLFCDYLMKHMDLNILNVKNALINNKEKQVYFKNYDASHWNMNGAYIGYQELMNMLKEDFPDVKILNEKDFVITKEKFKGLTQYHKDIDLLNSNFGFEDNIFKYDLKKKNDFTIVECELENIRLDPNLNFYHYHNDLSDCSQKLFIVGDSYIYSFLLPMLSESFQDVFFVRNTDAETIINISLGGVE